MALAYIQRKQVSLGRRGRGMRAEGPKTRRPEICVEQWG
jgi:hypothetical protein